MSGRRWFWVAVRQGDEDVVEHPPGNEHDHRRNERQSQQPQEQIHGLTHV